MSSTSSMRSESPTARVHGPHAPAASTPAPSASASGSTALPRPLTPAGPSAQSPRLVVKLNGTAADTLHGSSSPNGSVKVNGAGTEPSPNGASGTTPRAMLPNPPFYDSEREREVVMASASRAASPGEPNGKPSTPLFVSGQRTHRKVSCELCHRRKIKCDQGRPACGSCVRKGKNCNYFDEADTPTAAPNASGSAATPSGIVSAAPSVKAKSGSPQARDKGDKEKGKSQEKRNQRERILGGFDSDSDDGGATGGGGSGIGTGVTSSTNVDGALAELVAEEEIDELESDTEPPKKRGVSEELNGELLELVSGPPRVKRSRPSQPPPVLIPTPISAPPRHKPPKLPVRVPQPYAMTPVHALLISLPGPDIQHILLNTFFADPFLSEGISLLQPTYMEDLKAVTERHIESATTLGCTFAFLASALRILPEETSRLLLASAQTIQPRSLARLIAPNPSPDPTPLDQRYIELALVSLQLAELEPPTVMLVMLKLVLHRYMMIRRDRPVMAGQHLAGAIKVAQTLGMGKEWEGIVAGERELRRRVMWSIYIADRQFAFESALPYTIIDAHHGLHLPSPMSEEELYTIPNNATSLPAQNTELGPTPCTALFIHVHLARRLTPILDSFATMSPIHTPHELVLRFDQSLDTFQDSLPPYMRLFPLTDTRFDSDHPYLLAHRLRLHSTLLAYRQGVHRAFTLTYLRPEAPGGVRGAIASTSLSSLRTQRSFRMLDPKVTPRFFSAQVVFESAAVLALILYVDKAITGKSGMEGMTWRGGIAEGIELLDNVSDAEAGYARRAVRVLRDLTVKVDGPRRTLDDLTNGHGHDERKPERGPESVITWLDSLPTNVNMDVLLRDPLWEGGWEVVVRGM